MKVYLICCDERQAQQLAIPADAHVGLIVGDIRTIDLGRLAEARLGIVTAGNSFGLMDGGYDAAVVARFGTGVQDAVQERIADDYFGELPVGCAVSVPLDDPRLALIYAPTMQVPMTIQHTANACYATLAAMREARRLQCDAALVPLMGAGAGALAPEDAVRQIIAAVRAAHNPPTPQQLTWDYARERHALWHALCHIPE